MIISPSSRSRAAGMFAVLARWLLGAAFLCFGLIKATHPVDFLKRSLRVAQDRRGDGKLLEHLLLRIELPDLMMQQGVLLALFHPRRAADDDDG